VDKEPSILGPSAWMIIISLLLFWLPGFGPLIAGYVGGKRAGDVSHAFQAALLPMAVVGVVVFLILFLFMGPLLGPIAAGIGVVAGTYIFIHLALLEIALIAGAIIGGLLAEK